VNKRDLAIKLLAILDEDLPTLSRIDAYDRGTHDDPYMPAQADDEYKLLAKRATSNWCPLLVNTPAQALYVDSFRPGRDSVPGTDSPEWEHWQNSRLDARQIAVHRGALKFGHSFTLTESTRKGVISKGLSAMRTTALFEDAANDETPYAALTVTRWPIAEKQVGKARLWDGLNEYPVEFKGLTDKDSIRVGKGKLHGASECPVTRFAAAVDLEGRTTGVIEPMIPLQNRINQTVFDLLVTQTYASFKVRTVTGMAPPLKRDTEGDVVLDENGQPVPLPMNHSAKRFLFAEDHEAKFGTLDETPLGGFIESVDMSIRHLAAVSQTPPHHLLGQIANLSAEALLAAETALSRKVEEFRKGFGESWERVFRLAAEMSGVELSANDHSGEVIWRDMEQRSLAQSADALGKLGDQLGIPLKGLWERVPGVTKNELDRWSEMAEEDNTDLQLVQSLRRSSGQDTINSIPPSAPTG
jgi:hypothetical protein